jgi:DNA-directed RNA polymerase subunit RPC12/RpoP
MAKYLIENYEVCDEKTDKMKFVCMSCGNEEILIADKSDGVKCTCGGLTLVAGYVRPKRDKIHHPNHYTSKSMECREVQRVMLENL